MARRVWDASAPGCTLARPEGLPGRVAAPWTTRPRHDSLLITVQLHFFLRAARSGSQARELGQGPKMRCGIWLSSYRLWDTDGVRWTWTLPYRLARAVTNTGCWVEGGFWIGRKLAAQYARVHTYPAGPPLLQVLPSPKTRGGSWAKQPQCRHVPPSLPRYLRVPEYLPLSSLTPTF